MEKLLNKVKDKMVVHLRSNDQIADEQYLIIGKKSYTRRMLSNEIESETDIGVKLLSQILEMTLDLISRQAEKGI